MLQSNGTSLLEQVLKLTLLSLKIAVSTNVLLGDEDVGNGSLAGHLAKCGLDRRAIVCRAQVLAEELS